MSAPFRNNFRNTAKKLVNGAGSEYVYTETQQGVYDIDSGTVLESVSSVKKFLAYNAKLSYTEQRNPSYIEEQMQVLMVAYLDLPSKPQKGARVVNSLTQESLEIIDVKGLSDSSGVVAWRLICKRG